MLDKHLEPDVEKPEFRCECGDCEACCGNWEWRRDGFTMEQGIKIAEFNYECKLYNELERQIPGGL